MTQERDRILEELVRLFLSYRDVDEAYCKVSGVISRLYREEIDISIDEVQSRAYRCNEKEVK